LSHDVHVVLGVRIVDLDTLEGRLDVLVLDLAVGLDDGQVQGRRPNNKRVGVRVFQHLEQVPLFHVSSQGLDMFLKRFGELGDGGTGDLASGFSQPVLDLARALEDLAQRTKDLVIMLRLLVFGGLKDVVRVWQRRWMR